MSGFAPITAALLARKGDAEPSAPQKPAFVWQSKPAAVPVLPTDPPPRAHRIVVTLCDAEHQALGIAAVKKGVTRHQIVRDALNRHLTQLARDYGACACIGLGQPCARSCEDRAQL
jgi:hypothetical protein